MCTSTTTTPVCTHAHAQPSVPVNATSFPTCSHCGWRGGGHYKDCPFDMTTKPR
ncbi:hypothetical protein EXIGLDRAFT_719739 [Exidia glandulosa HHB12029]|uniref:Uncharacterized protein n=1 Tax=Exidia glandulosa HHB12029 TaxID=1314781 RepID=A0A165GU12_EXIGL|nr:hypothetical protein EXIGLDRAFT_719739 [Exidia glandulosa HHB12029]